MLMLPPPNIDLLVNEKETAFQFLNDYEARQAKSLEETITYQTQTTARRIERAKSNVEATVKLRQAGFKVEINKYNADYLTVETEAKELPRLHQVIGRMKKSHNTLNDSRKRLINVVLTVEAYPGLRISYKKKLPKDAKCKIERIKVPARTERRLVCEM